MAEERPTVVPEGEETELGWSDVDPYKNESQCLRLEPDSADVHVKQVLFKRDGNVHDNAAALLGVPPTERVRCFHLPFFEKRIGWSIHMYIDLQGVEHGLEHNTNASQIWLVANLPAEPPEVQPDTIHGPVLLTAEDVKTEEYIQLGQTEWDYIVKTIKEEQPNAQFLEGFAQIE